jgi:hypothetical protein
MRWFLGTSAMDTICLVWILGCVIGIGRVHHHYRVHVPSISVLEWKKTNARYRETPWEAFDLPRHSSSAVHLPARSFDQSIFGSCQH